MLILACDLMHYYFSYNNTGMSRERDHRANKKRREFRFTIRSQKEADVIHATFHSFYRDVISAMLYVKPYYYPTGNSRSLVV